MSQSLLIKIVLMAIAYFIAGKLSFLISVENEIVTLVIFAAEGIALAGVLLFGKRVWPGIFIGQFLINHSVGLDLLPSILISATNSLEALIAATAFALFHLDKALSKTRDITGLIALIFLVLQPFSSLVGNAVLVFFNIIESSNYFTSVFSWWLGNAMGQLLVTPFLLYFYHNYKKTNIISLFFTALFFFALSYTAIIYFNIRYLALLITITMPFIIYLSSNKELHYPTFGVIVIAIVSLYSTHLGVGIFSGPDIVENVISLNFYILSQVVVALYVGVLFSEKRFMLEKLNKIALYDYLTGLPNRYLLHERVEQAIIRSKRNKNKLAVCFIDVDRFKAINDTLGHDAGDTALREIGFRIKKNLREEDSLLRIGGDEFVLIITNVNTENDINRLLKRIHAEVNTPILIGKNAIDVTLSVGISLYPSDSESTVGLMTYADKAMYEAKNAGRNRFVFYGLESRT